MYVRVYVDSGGGDLYSISVNGGVETLLSTENCAFPSYSPDGKYIVFSSIGNGNSDIYIMNADGSNAKRLTQTSGSETESSFSPDGKKIAFASTGAGKTNIYTMNIDGSQVTQITQENDASSPCWR